MRMRQSDEKKNACVRVWIQLKLYLIPRMDVTHIHSWNKIKFSDITYFMLGQQWGNSRGAGAGSRGQSAPQHFLSGNFCGPTGKRGARKKGKMEKKKKENWKREGGKLKMEGGKVQNKERTFYFYLFIYLFFFFFSLFTFQNHWNLFWVYQMGIFYQEKAFQAGKKIWKNYIAPSEKYSSYASVGRVETCMPFSICRNIHI